MDVSVVCADGNECTKASAQSCGECIQAGEKCGWCTDVVSADKTIREGNGCSCNYVHLGKNVTRGISCSRMTCLFKCVTIPEDILSFDKQLYGENRNLYLRFVTIQSACNVLSDVV